MASSQTEKTEKSYLSSAIDSINPWNSSRPTAQPESSRKLEEGTAPQLSKPPRISAAEDHSTTPFYGQSLRSYAPDCPALNVRWYHAVDIPKRKPLLVKSRQASQAEAKPLAQPKKFVAFPLPDSRRIENGYQRQLEVAEDKRERVRLTPEPFADSSDGEQAATSTGKPPPITQPKVVIPVHEDHLFDVDIEKRELYPVYWLGPVYEIRRGTWFYQEGSSIRPCEENLASQLEEGYLKLKPWTHRPHRVRPSSRSPTPDTKDVLTQGQAEAAEGTSPPSQSGTAKTPTIQTPSLPSYRLFGAYMNNIATYQDANIAWLTSDNMLSWVATSVYEKFAGGGHFSGVKLLRGYSELHKNKDVDEKADKEDPAALTNKDYHQSERQNKSEGKSDLSTPPPFRQPQITEIQAQATLGKPRSRRDIEVTGERLSIPYSNNLSDESYELGNHGGRDIDHLILVTHGIGQRMGLRMESINFVNDVDVLRKTLKSVFSNSTDLKNLVSEFGLDTENCRVQVLPVCWRHKVEFPRAKASKHERDLGVNSREEEEYPSLEDITVEGVAFARSLISDLALDVLLYQSSYRREITQIVLEESNRIFKLFLERNPDFSGKIHLMGHSLGSAILFDILCQKGILRCRVGKEQQSFHTRAHHDNQAAAGIGKPTCLEFEVSDFYCLGSPIGLFQMLQGSTIAARSPQSAKLLGQHFGNDYSPSSAKSTSETDIYSGHLCSSVSSPAVAQLFNIFHPSDPISYRLEPLISTAMTAFKPQPLPYTKKGLFGSVAPQGLTSIGAKVGQSVSGLWSSLSAGIASNILKSSLGIGNDEMMEMSQQHTELKNESARAGGLDASDCSDTIDRQRQVLSDYLVTRSQNAISRGNETTNLEEFETLCSNIEANIKTPSKPGEIDYDGIKRKKLRVEDDKIRALNRNGRIDYSIQESALDFNPINAIASHMSYWADEDVSHFLLSQLLIQPSQGDRKGQ